MMLTCEVLYILLSNKLCKILFSQAKRRLEPEAGDPQELQDGGKTAKAKKPSLSHTGGKSKTLYCNDLEYGLSIDKCVSENGRFCHEPVCTSTVFSIKLLDHDVNKC